MYEAAIKPGTCEIKNPKRLGQKIGHKQIGYKFQHESMVNQKIRELESIMTNEIKVIRSIDNRSGGTIFI